MAIFKKNKKEETKKVSTQEDNELKDEISKAYDEIMSGNKEEKAEEQPQQAPKDDIAFENEVFKSKVKAFKQERNQQNLIAVLKMLSGRKFLLPSVCNVEDPFEKLENGNVRLKDGSPHSRRGGKKRFRKLRGFLNKKQGCFREQPCSDRGKNQNFNAFPVIPGDAEAGRPCQAG